jgi:hypothetical protein
MGILNLTNDGLPSVGIAVSRYIAQFGPASRPDIVRDLAPPGLSPAASDKVGHILNRWTQLGVFRESDGSFVLADDSVRDEICESSNPLHPPLRAYVLSRVMAFASSPEAGVEKNPVDDFLEAARWLLGSNPFTQPVHSWDQAQELNTPLVNNTRWPGFVEWMTFLGLAETFGESGWLLPNPAEAIGWFVPQLADGEPDVEWRPFIDRLGQILPLVPTNPSGGSLPVVTSLALQSLSDEGRIRLRLESDASVVGLTHPSGNKHRDFSHVTFVY